MASRLLLFVSLGVCAGWAPAISRAPARPTAVPLSVRTELRAASLHATPRNAPPRCQQLELPRLLIGECILIFAFAFARALGTILLAPDFPGWLAPVVMGATEQVRLSDTFGFASTGAVLWAACGITLGSFTTAANVNVESAVRVTARTWLTAFVVAAVAATARGGLTADEVQGSIGLGFSLATWRAVYAEEWWL